MSKYRYTDADRTWLAETILKMDEVENPYLLTSRFGNSRYKTKEEAECAAAANNLPFYCIERSVYIL